MRTLICEDIAGKVHNLRCESNGRGFSVRFVLIASAKFKAAATAQQTVFAREVSVCFFCLLLLLLDTLAANPFRVQFCRGANYTVLAPRSSSVERNSSFDYLLRRLRASATVCVLKRYAHPFIIIESVTLDVSSQTSSRARTRLSDGRAG